jgi:hypothetical protein
VVVFLSHSSKDKPIARRIAHALEERGLSVWLDEQEIRVGHSIPEKIADGIDAADVLCILISEESRGSKWVDREANAFLMQMLASDKIVLPCRLDDARPPTLLADIKYADFRSSFGDGLAGLLRAVKLQEEIDRCTRVDAATSYVADALSQNELAWFIAHFRGGSGHYFVSDRREERYPVLLDKLTGPGVLSREPDRYEIDWCLTPIGRSVLEGLDARVSKEERERALAATKRFRRAPRT